ncbi:amino acid adenylation domain-containing protein [Saccharopolyspora sp. MS10]|uniref:amino acid adenylation domain-containing protein n=1 Tax=Saccharopolyspora sp. MS10 TaxID=3385973 RepID=UPI0039A06037
MRELELLHELRAARVLVWRKDNGRLGFSHDKDGGFPPELRDRVVEAKDELLELLRVNRIDSAERARTTAVCKVPEHRRDRRLTSVQRGMYLQSRIDALGCTYTIPLFVDLPRAEPEFARQAVRALLEREPILRTRVRDDLGWDPLPVESFEIGTARVPSAELAALRDDRARTEFPLDGGALVLPEVVELTDRGGVVVGLTHHHMLSDAPSAEVLAGKLAELHDVFARGDTPAPRTDLDREPDFADHAAHQEVEARTPEHRAARAELARRLAGAEELALGDVADPAADNSAVTTTRSLGPRLHRSVLDFAHEHRISTFAVLFTALHHVLTAFAGGRSGFPVATAIGNRPAGFESAVGPFIATAPVLAEHRSGESFAANARRVHEEVLWLNEHQQLNLEELTDELPGGGADLAELVRVLFTYHNFRAVPGGSGTEHRVLPYADVAEKFGISVIAKDEGDDTSLTATCAAARYEPELVAELLDSYLVCLASAMNSDVDAPLSSLRLVAAERLRALEAGNATAVDHGGPDDAVGVFEQQVRRTPDGIAVVFGDRVLTYRELDERANRLARVLRDQHAVERQSLVCLLLDRSEHLLVAVLGVLKAGCAYVPMDPEWPAERVRFVLDDTATPVVLTDQERAGSWAGEVAALAVDDPELGRGLPSDPTGIPVRGRDLAYAIYTSGTTGRPKGVLCEHRGLVNRIRWMNRRFPLGPADRVVQKTPYTFDVSVWELLWANWFGAAVVLAEPGAHKDPERLVRLIERERVTVVHFVPSMLAAFTDSLRSPGGPDPAALRGLRLLFCSGEELKLGQVRAVHELLPGVRVNNLYGPTEASIDVLHHDCSDHRLERVRLGAPIDNMRVHVLAEAGIPLPAHAIGELHLGGVGLARGYLNLPELTDERFVPDPAVPGERLYRTGDLVRRLTDGDVVFVGRADSQVKVRGFRIELGEIEAALERHPEVRRGAAVVRDERLVGYYVSGRELDDELDSLLRAVLPEHAVPAALVRLDDVPVTANGKLDRAALPEPTVLRSAEFTEPRDEREARIRELCAAALGLRPQDLSTRADLSRLGLDSLVAIRLTGWLRQHLDSAITVREVFSHRTVERMRERVDGPAERPAAETPVLREQGLPVGPADLLPVQSWFLGLPLSRPHHWNQAFQVRTPELEPSRLDAALRELTAHHDAFRLRIGPDGAQHYVQNPVHPGLHVLDVRALPGAEDGEEFTTALRATLTAWQRGFDLDSGPLHAFGYLHGFADGSARVFLALHHLIVDGVSQRVLAEDLRSLYEGRSPGAKGTSYRQWARALAEHDFGADRAFWLDRRGAGGAFPLDSAHPALSADVVLGEPETALLVGDCHRAYRTSTEDLLLTALARALRETTGQEAHEVLVEGHGREEFATGLDVTRTLGWFTTFFPVRLRGEPDAGAAVRAVKEELRAIPGRGLSYGPLFGYRDLPAVWFNFLGHLDGGTGDWEIVRGETGETMPDGVAPGAAVSVLAEISGGRLRMRLDSGIGPAATEALRDALERALTDVVEHCRTRESVRYTPSDFAAVGGEADLRELPAAIGADPHGWFAMTDLQQAYLVGRLGGYEIGNVANHVYTEHVYPHLDVERLETAINRLVAECDVLRTVFSTERLAQRVLPASEVPHYAVRVHEFADGDEDLLLDVRDRMSHEVHDPESFPLFAFEVSRFPDRCVLHAGFDLITVDVRSRLALLRRLDALYRGEQAPPALPAATFKDYQDHVELLRSSKWYADDRAHWQRRLAEMPARCALPFRTPPEAVVHPRFAEHSEHVAAEVWDRFAEQAAARGLSPSSVLLALFGSVLAHHSGTTEFPITVTVARRLPVLPEVGEVLGNFTSTVLHHFIDESRDAELLARRTHDVLWEDVSHALYSGVQVQRDAARTNGLDTAKAVSPIVFTGAVGGDTRDFEGAAHLSDDEDRSGRYWEAQTSQAWIDLQAVRTPDGFTAKWLYVEQLFHRADIEHFNLLLRGLIERLADGDWTLPKDRYTPEADRALIAAANDAEREAAEETLFGAHRARCATDDRWDAVAVVDVGTGRAHTHRELVADGDHVARLLTGRSEALIAVLAEKGYGQVLATTAIMRAGAGYLPLHVEWPVARLADVLEQAGASSVLVSRAQWERAEVRDGLAAFELIVIEEALAADPVDVPLPAVAPDDVAYVIFTSGSTGRPKGVTISHRGALNTVLAVNERFGIGPADRVLAVSELSFDLSVYDLFGPLAAGGAVVFPEQRRAKDPAHWAELVRRHEVTVWNTVPQLAGLLVDEEEPLPPLRLVLMSGDWIPTNLPDRIRDLVPGALVVSLGGATEGSIWSVWFEVGEVDPGWVSVPYGVAMPGQRMYVLTADGTHAPVGVPGEIHIGGAGVALGYWRAPELSAERFVEHPVLGRLYRTGDVGRWSRSGWMEFLGRTDFQVKLNGYRVELGEVESALARHPRVEQAVADVRDVGGVQSLVGYYVARERVDAAELRALLAERLPAYMVPERLLHLAEPPLSPNGKLDRSALPEVDAPAAPAHVAPRTADQLRLRDLWAEVLGVPGERLGIRDDLLRAGVDSIVAIRMTSRLRRELGLAVAVRDVFAHRTIESFCAEVLPHATSRREVRAEQGVLDGEAPPLPIHSWFAAQRFPRPQHWNQAFLIETPELGTDVLRGAVTAVLARHDALRLRESADGYRYDPDVVCPEIRELDVRTLPAAEGTPGFSSALDEVLTSWQSDFDLRTGPLLAVGRLHGYDDGGHRLFLAVHHVAVDAVSWRILVDDLRSACAGERLGPKSTSTRQWARAAADRARAQTGQLPHWDAVTVPVPAALRPHREPVETELEFDAELTRRVLHDCPRFLRTGVHELLLAALAAALTELTGATEHGVVLEGHGREDLGDDLDITRTVGWFTSLYPFALRTSETPVATLIDVKESLRAVPGNGADYGTLIGYDRPLPPVCFNYLGQLDGGTGENWRITAEPAGRAIHPDNALPHAVNLAGLVVGGRLRFRLGTRLPDAGAALLADAFRRQLTDLVAATADQPRGYLTASDIGGVLPQEQLDRVQADRELEDVLPATSLQRGLLAHAMRNGDVDDAYRVQVVWDYHAELEPDSLRQAWEAAQHSFSALRTLFDWSREPVQVIARRAELNWRYLDLAEHPDPRRAFDELLAEDRATPYDTGTPGLFRVRLCRLAEGRYACLLNTHHAILDGWSSPILVDAVHDAYRALRDGRPVPRPADHAPAVHRRLRPLVDEHAAYWRERVRGLDGSCDLGGLLRPERRHVDLGTRSQVEDQRQEVGALDADLLQRVRGAAARGGVTFNAVLQYAWHRLLAAYGHSTTTVVGTVLAGRDLPADGIDEAVGLFLSTVPLVVRHDGSGTLLDEVRELQDAVQEANARSAVDLAALQPPDRRLFDTLFIYENYPGSRGDRSEPHPVFRFRHQKRDYPLVLSAVEDAEAVALVLDFAAELIAPETARRLLRGVESVLARFAEAPESAADGLVLADDTDLARQADWNDTGSAEPEQPLVHRAFEQQAARNPHAPAVQHAGQVLSYARLNEDANRLARHLVSASGEGERFLLLLDRGPRLLTALLAVLKSGGAYIPVDADYPDERIRRMIRGSGARGVITERRHAERVARRWPELVSVVLDDPDTAARIDREDPANRDVAMRGDEPAYVLHTSGSTGDPKGVVVGHRSVTGVVEAVRGKHFAGAGPLRTCSMTNHVFDIFGLEYGLTLLTGGSVVLADPMVPELDCAGLDFVQMTPSLLEMKRDVLRNTGSTRLLVGGEKLERHLLTAAVGLFAEVVNVYGPTETTIWSTSRTYRSAPADSEPVSIGRALPGERAHVLGRGGEPLPVGAVGELHIGGAGLAHGYAGDPELTALRFVDEHRLYRTGDLVRWFGDGELEFLGRGDGQVKLRGHRIDLGEVDAALVAHPDVRHGLARVHTPDGAPAAARLLAYYVPAAPDVDEEALRRHLAELLPAHAMPSALVGLDEIPLTHSGKLDAGALPVPGAEAASRQVEPRDEIEAELARAWREVLGLERIGVHDRFFDLGGNSVLLTQVHGRLAEPLRHRLRLNDLFTRPTIAELAAHLTGGSAADAEVVVRGPVAERDIAVIGMACRFPDADDVTEFWRNLTAGHESIVRLDREELRAAGVDPELLDRPDYVPAQSRLRDIAGFDAGFFGFSRHEAEIMDPQHRVFLECAWHALEDAFHDPHEHPGSIGLFAGVGRNGYLDEHVRPALAPLDPAAEYQAMIHNRPDFLPTKTAYRLDLTGPAVTVQTACSSSLVAVHQAAVALLAGDCDVALAGGVSIGKLGTEGYLHQEGMVFSPDGRCRAFDADARGTVEGQGVGLVVLKPLERALADGDPVRAVLKGSAINNDGHDKVGYTAPSARRQAAVIKAAHRRAGVVADTIGYVEAHGTGTALGDPIEFAGLRAAFDGGASGPDRVLGAVKTNIGHLDAASGIAGFIKAVLCLENRQLVPTLHHRAPNPALEIEGSGFRIGTEHREWPGDVLRAGVSSFGIGGTNAHAVLEQAPAAAARSAASVSRKLLVVSGPTPEAVRRQSDALAAHLADHPDADLSRVGYTLLSARHRFDFGRVVVGEDPVALRESLHREVDDHVPARAGRPVVFLFPGQGAQHSGMGAGLYAAEPAFRSAVDECAAVLREVFPDVAEEDLLGRTDRVHEPLLTQPALFVTEYALARLLLARGLRPAAMLGHSLGEYVAACLAGVFSTRDALRLVCARARATAASEAGAMLAVPLPAEDARADEHGLDLAAVNDADSCVLSGPVDAVERCAARLAERGVVARRLPVRRAFHSRLLDPVLDEFERAFDGISAHRPVLPFVSGLTGDWADPDEVTRPRYWVRHLREQVAFAAGLDRLHHSAETADALLVEVGPGRALTRFARKNPRRAEALAVAAMPDPEREHATALAALGTAHAAGARVDADALFELTPADRVRLPGYAFDRAEHWVGRAPDRSAPVANPAPASAIDSVVVEAWRAVLGVDQVRPEDDFFEHGGDSLAVVQLAARIERGTGRRVEFMSLPRHTPAALLEHLRQPSRGPASGSPVVRVRQGEPDLVAPLVLVHPIGGDVYFYRELAQHLPEDQPVFALRSPMLDGAAEFDTVEAIAESYLNTLDELGLKPPYRLGGSSFGGIVAYEMAQLVFQRTGCAPEVVLIDSPAHGNLPERLSEVEILHYLVRYGLPAEMFPLAEVERVDGLRAKIDHLARSARGTPFEEMLSSDFLPRYLDTWRRHDEAMHRYVPRPYEGDLVFFAHEEEIADFPAGQDRWWRALARGGWRQVAVPGNHLSMNAMPHVARIAEDLGRTR